jgi:phosphatidylserine decarboxylase
MYHRFHAPCDGRLESVRRIAGDTWNVNPVTLRVIERVFCRNARAILELHSASDGSLVTLVPVAAILVSSLRIHGLDTPLDAAYAGPAELRPARPVRRGDELGYFEHGSTIIVFAPTEWQLDARRTDGSIVRAGMPLFRRPPGRNTADK